MAVALGDLAPPGVRYGYVHPLAGRLLQRELPSVGPIAGLAFASLGAGAPTPVTTGLTCVLAADHLDVGGIGRVVEMLALGLASAGTRPVVLCPGDGERARRLRALGIQVTVAVGRDAAESALRSIGPDVVQVHSAPHATVEASAAFGSLPVVPVLHNTEIHYDAPQWARTGVLFDRAERIIAVSSVVREFHLRHLPRTPPDRIVVVPNGTMPLTGADDEHRTAARAQLERAVGRGLEHRLVLTCLARYDSQKNLTGLVAGFLRAIDGGGLDDVVLVLAGDPSDWLELRRAAAVARAHPRGDQVCLLGRCDAAALLAASDGFVLDSFFEGWPVATTEGIAAGLPIVVSDTGGARELVELAAPGSALVANPSGPAAAVTDASVRRARRRARHQANAPELARALRSLAAVLREQSRPAAPSDTGFDAMIDGHVSVLREVLAS